MLRSLMHRNPAHMRAESPFLALREDLDRLFDHWMTDVGPETARLRTSEETWFQPKVDMTQTDKLLIVKAELPGIEKKDIHVLVVNDQLVLSGEKKAVAEEKDGGYFRKERYFGSFRRELPLPVHVYEDKVEAKFKNGILTVKMPKMPEAQTATKEIAID